MFIMLNLLDLWHRRYIPVDKSMAGCTPVRKWGRRITGRFFSHLTYLIMDS